MRVSMTSFLLGVSSLAGAVPYVQTPSGNGSLKRDEWNYPRIGEGIDVNDPDRGGKLPPRPESETSGALNNAYELLAYATSTSDTPKNNAIFAKYFDSGDKQLVMSLFNRLLGDGAHGAPAMTNMVIVRGDTDPNDPAPAELKEFDDPEPQLILTEDAWVYPDRDGIDDACAQWDDEGMTQDMYLLGSILLHEYMHWDWFLGSLHHGEIIDQPNGYGWANARALDKTLAKYNADSYGWYATENLWAIICNKDTGYEGED